MLSDCVLGKVTGGSVESKRQGVGRRKNEGLTRDGGDGEEGMDSGECPRGPMESSSVCSHAVPSPRNVCSWSSLARDGPKPSFSEKAALIIPI